MATFRKFFSNVLATLLLFVGLGCRFLPSVNQGENQYHWSVSFDSQVHTDALLPGLDGSRVQIEGFKFSVDQFCFSSTPFAGLVAIYGKLIDSWFENKKVFFDQITLLFPFHFFW